MTTALFPDHADALFSPCGCYRYRLWRRWGERASLGFIMLNPSTADAKSDDPTIRKCIGFAKRLGYDGIEVVNLYAWRSTDPAGLRLADDPIGPRNDGTILGVSRLVSDTGGLVICAWGANATRDRKRSEDVLDLLLNEGIPVYRLRTNGDRTPAHPLMLPYSCEPTEWRWYK